LLVLITQSFCRICHIVSFILLPFMFLSHPKQLFLCLIFYSLYKTINSYSFIYPVHVFFALVASSFFPFHLLVYTVSLSLVSFGVQQLNMLTVFTRPHGTVIHEVHHLHNKSLHWIYISIMLNLIHPILKVFTKQKNNSDTTFYISKLYFTYATLSVQTLLYKVDWIFHFV
jgi:hypothetical protein